MLRTKEGSEGLAEGTIDPEPDRVWLFQSHCAQVVTEHVGSSEPDTGK